MAVILISMTVIGATIALWLFWSESRSQATRIFIIAAVMAAFWVYWQSRPIRTKSTHSTIARRYWFAFGTLIVLGIAGGIKLPMPWSLDVMSFGLIAACGCFALACNHERCEQLWKRDPNYRRKSEP